MKNSKIDVIREFVIVNCIMFLLNFKKPKSKGIYKI